MSDAGTDTTAHPSTDPSTDARTGSETRPEALGRELGFMVTHRGTVGTVLTDPISLAWLTWCTHEGVPATTTERRRTTLRSVGNAGTATREEIEAWWSSRADRAAATRATDLACLRSFYRWAALWEHRADDPSIRLRSPKVSPGLPRPADDDDVSRLLSLYRDTDPELFRAYTLGALAGLRVSEVAALRWNDVDQVGRHITVRGKGGKTRRIAVDHDTLELLGTPGALTDNVVTGHAEPYNAARLQRRANRGLKRAGVNATFHQLRHRFGTKAYQQSKDLVAVRNLMGHASIATTSVYAAAADEVAQQIARAVTLRLPPKRTQGETL